MVQYVSNASCRTAITNKNTYSTIILTFKPLLLFSFLNVIFDFSIDFSFDFNFYNVFNICILLTPFQQFNELFFHYVGECVVCSKNRSVLTLIRKLYTDAVIKRCSAKQVFGRSQKTAANHRKQQNPWKTSFNKLSFNKKIQFLSMLLYFHRKTKINKVSSQVFFKLFVELF